MEDQNKRILEALLFASQKPLSIEQIREVLGLKDAKETRMLIDGLKCDYERENRSFRLCPIAGGFQLSTDPAFAPWIRKLYNVRRTEKLSGPSLETLAIIAYRQPVTRSEVEMIRGVNVEGTLKTLLKMGLVRITGKKKVPGRPFVYGTTRSFLEYFGLNSLQDLPALDEFDISLGEERLKEMLEDEAQPDSKED